MKKNILSFLVICIHPSPQLWVNAWTGLQSRKTGWRILHHHMTSETPQPQHRSCLSANVNDYEIPSSLSVSSKSFIPLGVYIHIPYCQRRCRYCDFAIVPIGSSSTSSSSSTSTTLVSTNSNHDNSLQKDGFHRMDERYRQAVVDEIRWTFQHSQPPNRPISSIYFGGGTPSLAPLETIRSILHEIRSHTLTLDDLEITMEMDPGTLDERMLRDLAALGINRISLGVQTLNDDVLEYIGRVHRLVDIENAMNIIHTVYCCNPNMTFDDNTTNPEGPNVSIDLISGLPGVSIADWADVLERTVHHYKPSHISIYDLQIEKNTVFGKWYSQEDEDATTIPYNTQSSLSLIKDQISSNGSHPQQQQQFNVSRYRLPSPDDSAYMYRYASGYLRSEGYEHYEISSYARPGKRSRHNQVYWGYDTEWYAFGLGSTSFWNQTRIARPRAMADYLDWVQQKVQTTTINTHNYNDIIQLQESSSLKMDIPNWKQERLTDILLTRLRTSDGLDLHWVQTMYGDETIQSILRGVQLAIDLDLVILEKDDSKLLWLLRLRDPLGFLFSNTILSNIFVELSED
jgi:coproporphyrinogen III oxidase-like Fe-S oxidoreductase